MKVRPKLVVVDETAPVQYEPSDEERRAATLERLRSYEKQPGVNPGRVNSGIQASPASLGPILLARRADFDNESVRRMRTIWDRSWIVPVAKVLGGVLLAAAVLRSCIG